jgi:hypothetical protein
MSKVWPTREEEGGEEQIEEERFSFAKKKLQNQTLLPGKARGEGASELCFFFGQEVALDGVKYQPNTTPSL